MRTWIAINGIRVDIVNYLYQIKNTVALANLDSLSRT